MTSLQPSPRSRAALALSTSGDIRDFCTDNLLLVLRIRPSPSFSEVGTAGACGVSSGGGCPRRAIPSERAANRGRGSLEGWGRPCGVVRVALRHCLVLRPLLRFSVRGSYRYQFRATGLSERRIVRRTRAPAFCCRSRNSCFHFRGPRVSGGRENKTTVLTHTDGHFLLASKHRFEKEKKNYKGISGGTLYGALSLLLNSINPLGRCTLAHASDIHRHCSVISAIHFLLFLVVAIGAHLSVLPPPPFLPIASAEDSPQCASRPECYPRYPIAIAEHNPIRITNARQRLRSLVSSSSFLSLHARGLKEKKIRQWW
jgi:hypothetical protein